MIGEKIRKAREEKRYTQDYMAAQLGLNQSTYCRIETGDIRPSIEQLHHISLVLNVPFSGLTDFPKNGNSPNN